MLLVCGPVQMWHKTSPSRRPIKDFRWHPHKTSVSSVRLKRPQRSVREQFIHLQRYASTTWKLLGGEARLIIHRPFQHNHHFPQAKSWHSLSHRLRGHIIWYLSCHCYTSGHAPCMDHPQLSTFIRTLAWMHRTSQAALSHTELTTHN